MPANLVDRLKLGGVYKPFCFAHGASLLFCTAACRIKRMQDAASELHLADILFEWVASSEKLQSAAALEVPLADILRQSLFADIETIAE
jgi:hypothetical protein